MAEPLHIEHAPQAPAPKPKRERRPTPVHASVEDLQRDIDALQDQLLMDKLHPEEEKRLTKLIALRRSHNQERPVTKQEQEERLEIKRLRAKLGPQPTMPPYPEMEAIPVLIDEPETSSKERPDLGIGDQERIMKLLTDEERKEVAKARVERTLAPRRKALKDAKEEEAWIATRMENTYGKHPATLDMERSHVKSKLGRWFKRGLHSLMGEPSPDETLARDLAEWRTASALVEKLRESVGEMDMTGVGAARVADRRLRADQMRKEQAEGDRAAAQAYRAEREMVAPGGPLQERDFFEDSRSMDQIADEETFRKQHGAEIERARQLFTEYAGNVPHDKKASADHREYAAVLWNEVNGKLGRRSAGAMEKAAQLMGTRDVATAYLLDLARLAEMAIEESQDTREQITDLEESVKLTRELTEASERVRALNRLLGWDEERNIRPRQKLAAPRKIIKQAA